MTSVSDMIRILRDSRDVVGLAEYGSASYRDERMDGDYDLIVIVGKCSPNVESLHFHMDNTPVDLNIRTLEQIKAMNRAEGFEAILLDARVIHDPSGQVGAALRSLRDRHMRTSVPPIAQGRAAAMRHGAKHTFDKLEGQPDLPTTLRHYLLHQCVYWAVPQYFEIRGLPYKGEKHALAYLRDNEPDLSDKLEAFYTTADLDEQGRLARAIQETVLSPVGGLWRHGELLTFGDQSEGEKLFQRLFGRASPSGRATGQRGA